MEILKPKDVAEMLNVSIKTLQRWDRDGVFVASRNAKNRRYYTKEQVNKYLGIDNLKERKVIVYARVSNRGQKNDLENQIQFIREYLNANGIIMDEEIKDISSGLNYNKKEWNKLLERVIEKEIDTIYITYKDRFIRFGFEWFERFCQKFGTKIVVLNNKTTSPEEEFVDDLISIVHVFSSRIYGFRKYKKILKEDDELN